MKKIALIAVIAITISLNANSQITNIIATSDSNLVINNAYVGILNTTAFRTDSLKADNYYGVRIGGQASWQALPWLKAKAFVVYDRMDGADAVLNSFSIKVHTKQEKLGLEFGRMATLSTESRPLPATAAGHFETWAEARIPGSAIGAKASYKFGSNMIGAGIAVRDNKPEYHTRFNSKYIDLAACYTAATERFQTSAVVRAGRVYSVIVYENVEKTNLIANFTNVTVAKKAMIDFYFDAGYRLEKKDFDRLEFGLMKNFESKWLKGLLCLGYKYETRTVNAYMFLHI